MVDAALIPWLLDSDPALRWQVERDFLHEPAGVWEATRTRIATEGFGARLLALQDPDGQWAAARRFRRRRGRIGAGARRPVSLALSPGAGIGAACETARGNR